MAEKLPYYLPEGLPAPMAQRDGMDAGFWEALRRHELVCSDAIGARRFSSVRNGSATNARAAISDGIACQAAGGSTPGCDLGTRYIRR